MKTNAFLHKLISLILFDKKETLKQIWKHLRHINFIETKLLVPLSKFYEFAQRYAKI